MIRFNFVLGLAGQQWPTNQHSECHSVDAPPCYDQAAEAAVKVKDSSFLVNLVGRLLVTVIIAFLMIPVLYYCLIVAIPLHWIYDPLPPAGPMSVYLPGMSANALAPSVPIDCVVLNLVIVLLFHIVIGAGFSGFWWHLGLLQAIPDPWQYEYYCYSSGCLGILVTLMLEQQHQKQYSASNATIHGATTSTTTGVNGFDLALSTSLETQSQWLAGNVSNHEIVDTWLNQLFLHFDEDFIEMEEVVNRINVLITAPYDERGVLSVKATSRTELQNLLVKTTWM
jgi:hypothetical protein